MDEFIYHQNICSTIKIIRNYKGLKQNYVSVKSGFKDRSVYAKTESGQIKSLPITKFNAICETLQCNGHVLLLLAAVDNFSYKISSWSEFMDSI